MPTGTRVAVYGSSGGSAQYVLDGGGLVEYRASSTTNLTNMHSLLYESQEVPFGIHTLQANITNATIGLQAYRLDWISYNVTSTSIQLPSSSMVSTSPASQSTASAQNGQSNRSPRHLTSAEIVGCVVAGIVALVLLVLLFRQYVRNRKRGREKSHSGYKRIEQEQSDGESCRI